MPPFLKKTLRLPILRLTAGTGQCGWGSPVVEGAGRSADDLAMLRDAGISRNAILVERPNGHFGQTMMRQFLFDAYHVELLADLTKSSDARIAAIAAKSLKEVEYVERSATTIVTLGDGTQESHARMQAAWTISGHLPANCSKQMQAMRR